MKILQNGWVDYGPGWADRAYLCPNCNSVMWITREDDAAIISADSHVYEGWTVLTTCPACDREQRLAELEHTETYAANREYWDEVIRQAKEAA